MERFDRNRKIITDDKFKKIIEKQKKFIKERTNSEKLEVVTTGKETFKKKCSFKIKDEKGEICIKTINNP